LQAIPYGETITYGELARRIDNPKGSRAVGLANGANPIPIVVPCHRVIGSNGKLTGFGGGLDTKEKLLTLERGLQGNAQGENPWQRPKKNVSIRSSRNISLF
jgi:methylated-DNA-[protein]-cysteine S-methyltransferase